MNLYAEIPIAMLRAGMVQQDAEISPTLESTYHMCYLPLYSALWLTLQSAQFLWFITTVHTPQTTEQLQKRMISILFYPFGRLLLPEQEMDGRERSIRHKVHGSGSRHSEVITLSLTKYLSEVRRSYAALFWDVQIAHRISSRQDCAQPCFASFARLRSFLMTSSQLVNVAQMPITSTERLIAYEVRYLGPKTVLKT
ncbi:hypothetical protein BU25DRAFT_50771 [Macroventuria anomochaeta]|uniref:Uncharacterized protein n=1 Tax=Macroventuria anomochaeta TaxID=301207 RepID=A0ACB6S0P4_9PLEO|nr:uncharacterized protein BU25DRAFT_50771 [Macroventuria anomochaeta]KAF2627603.1 hypothetical protein BU25DRAFT_50771 [Macroventuria anomochaeta]